jgi:outer membrane protein, heavy metal efflux system
MRIKPCVVLLSGRSLSACAGTTPLLLAVGASALLSGCGSVNPRPAFADVEESISDRTGHHPVWARTPAEGQQAEQSVSELLKDELTVEAAVRIALANNRSLQATFEEIGVSQSDLAQAGLVKNPELDGFLRFPKGLPPGTNVELGLVQDVLDILTMPLRKKIGTAQLEQTKLRVGNDVLGLIAEVKTAYFTLQAAQQLVTRLELIMDVNRAAAEFARKQHEAGTMNDLDFATHRATYDQSKVDVAIEATQVRAARERLNRLLGLWGSNAGGKIAKELPEIPDDDIPLEGLESLAIDRRLDVAAARWGVDVVGRALALKRRTRYFPVGLNVGVQTEKDSGGQRVTGPSLALQLPIFDTGKASIARLEAQHRQAQRQLEALAINARSEVREARDLVSATRGLARYYGTVLLPERVEILDLTLKHHNMMLKGTYDLLLAKQSEVATERAYIGAWRDYWIARTQLERAVGGRLDARAEPLALSSEGGRR